MNKQILIAAAWPYANASLHLGHVSALIGADILARYFRLSGNNVLYVSGSDCHGTPIVFEADKKDISPKDIADKYHKEFKDNLIKGMDFSYDVYANTMTKNHEQVVREIFLDLYNKGLIYEKEDELPYCSNCNKFLPDRYIEGECPVCHFDSARGDQCDECGNLMNPMELINPKCKNCGATPEWKKSKHFYLKLSYFENKLKKWVKDSEGWRKNAKNFTANFLEEGLHDRAITRDITWGIPIPIEGYETKSIYVWFEAVCGYLSASKEKGDWKDFWENNSVLHYYVHGKDNIPFHTIIWPSILMGKGGLHLPDKIISSEYLTLEGKQFSKSRGWAVWLSDFLKEYDSETLRYYLIINGSETSDADFSWKEYQIRTNSELIANFGNLVNRVFSMIKRNFPEGVYSEIEDEEILVFAEKLFDEVGEKIEEGKFREALKLVFTLVEKANKYLEDNAPWSASKEESERTLFIIGHVVKSLAVLINPFLPKTSDKIRDLLNENNVLEWHYPKVKKIVIDNVIPLYNKIEDEQVMDEESKLRQL
jgi:methionyl-tRNA synthetase